MKDTPMPSHTSALFDDAPLSDADAQRMALSAWVDGEGDDPAWDDAWAADTGVADDGGVHEAWHRYQLIGDVLRAGQNATAWAGSADAMASASAVAFARRVTEAAQQQGQLTQVNPLPVTPSVAVRPVVQDAANDGVFRWKMVAGVASFTAVLGIAWGVAGGAGQGGGAVLAVAPTAAPVVQSVQLADSTPVLVSTPQGQVLRDARLQELMQTHRQLGGASALQAPAGFLRTSTLDTHQR